MLLLGLALAATTVLGVLWAGDRSGRPAGSWADGEVHGQWRVVFTGYGEVSGDDGAVVLEPRSADSADVTHGGLVVTTGTWANPDFEITVRTEEQVRRGEPNPWEVGWVLWNHQDNDHFYAVALKPHGWEISKQDPAYPGKQRFLASGTDRQFPLGRDHRVRVEHDGPRATVSVDGAELATVHDEERPYQHGAIGLYTEDARVRFADLEVTGSAGGPDRG